MTSEINPELIQRLNESICKANESLMILSGIATKAAHAITAMTEALERQLLHEMNIDPSARVVGPIEPSVDQSPDYVVQQFLSAHQPPTNS